MNKNLDQPKEQSTINPPEKKIRTKPPKKQIKKFHNQVLKNKRNLEKERETR